VVSVNVIGDLPSHIEDGPEIADGADGGKVLTKIVVTENPHPVGKIYEIVTVPAATP
jgi:hypothetical protein